MHLGRTSLVFSALQISLQGATAQDPNRACNNSPLLCDRAYNNVTYLGAHDSMFVRNESNLYSLAGDQFFPSPVQLDAGVRLLTGQVHTVTSLTGDQELHLCHTLCALYDAGLFSSWLASVKAWLDNNPNDVVTILLVNGDNVATPDYESIFDSVNMTDYVYAPQDTTQATADWPTLNELIDMNKRLIAYFQPLLNSSSYLLDQFVFTFENQYDNTDPSQFSCDANRPDSLKGDTAGALSSHRLPVMNHFLYDSIGTTGIEIPAVENVSMTNAPSGAVGNLGDAADNCTKVYGKPPTYVIVDFVNVGPAIDTVDRLNGVGDSVVGRRSLPNRIYTAGPGPTETLPISRTTTSSSKTVTSASRSSTQTPPTYSNGTSSKSTASETLGNHSSVGTKAATTPPATTPTATPTTAVATSPTATPTTSLSPGPNSASRIRHQAMSSSILLSGLWTFIILYLLLDR